MVVPIAKLLADKPVGLHIYGWGGTDQGWTVHHSPDLKMTFDPFEGDTFPGVLELAADHLAVRNQGTTTGGTATDEPQ